MVDDVLGGETNLVTGNVNKAICVTPAFKTAFEAAMATNDDAYLTYYNDVKLFRDSNDYFLA